MVITNKKWEKETFVCVNNEINIYHFFKVGAGYYNSSPYTIEEFDNFEKIEKKYKKKIKDRKLDKNLNKIDESLEENQLKENNKII